MNNLVKVIGEIVLTILIIIIPMLTTFSFCLDWFDDIKWILILLKRLGRTQMMLE